jgi:hypothetical protein
MHPALAQAQVAVAHFHYCGQSSHRRHSHELQFGASWGNALRPRKARL